MIKKIIAGFCLLFASVAFSQENNASPYSYYGLGDQKFKGTTENRSMAGLGVQGDSIHINLMNPATYNSIKSTTFTMGAGVANTNLETSTSSDKVSRASIDYLAVALPFNKLAVAFGLMPFTSVGYKIKDTEVGSDNITRNKSFDGSGGINRVFAGVSYQIIPELSVGADLAYNFGNIETTSLVNITGVQYATQETNKSHYSGASVNLAANFNTKINNKLRWTSSVTYSPGYNLSSDIDRQISTVSTVNGATNGVLDVVSYSEDVKMPAAYSIGTGIGQDRKWFAGAQYIGQGSNEMGNRFDQVTDAAFQSSYKISLGGYYIPNYMSLSSYISRITYRAGIKYENTGLVINNEEIKDYGFTFGLGLPVNALGYTAASNVNIGVEVGKRGTTNAGLVQENYVNVFLSLSFNDRWFTKRRYE